MLKASIIAGMASLFAMAVARAETPGVQPPPGFTAIFNGKTLEGWEGDPKYWRVEDGAIVGEVTPETLLKQNSFLIWRGGKPANFELMVDFRVSAKGNSGINYRSVEVPDAPLALRGYQADLDGENRYTGQNYEERGRKFLALPGQAVRLAAGEKPTPFASLSGETPVIAAVKDGDWNSYHLIIQGNLLLHMVNGRLFSVVIDDDATARTTEGLLGVQVHVGPPMKIEYRNFFLKTLP